MVDIGAMRVVGDTWTASHQRVKNMKPLGDPLSFALKRAMHPTQIFEWEIVEGR
jgi:hypothetical protein